MTLPAGTIIGSVCWSGFIQPAGWSSSQFTIHQTSRTVFFSHNKPVGTVFFSQVLNQRTEPKKRSNRCASIQTQSFQNLKFQHVVFVAYNSSYYSNSNHHKRHTIAASGLLSFYINLYRITYNLCQNLKTQKLWNITKLYRTTYVRKLRLITFFR